MDNNYLITGYWGEPHVTAENDRGINAGIMGAGRYVLPVGQQFRAEYIGNNTVRIYDGKLFDNGAAAGIPAGKYIDMLVPETNQGMKRNDILVFQYQKDFATLVESGVFTIVHGEETTGTPSDPELEQQDLLTDEATFDQMPLFRITVNGASISNPVALFEVRNGNGSGISNKFEKNGQIFPIGSNFICPKDGVVQIYYVHGSVIRLQVNTLKVASFRGYLDNNTESTGTFTWRVNKGDNVYVLTGGTGTITASFFAYAD